MFSWQWEQQVARFFLSVQKWTLTCVGVPGDTPVHPPHDVLPLNFACFAVGVISGVRTPAMSSWVAVRDYTPTSGNLIWTQSDQNQYRSLTWLILYISVPGTVAIGTYLLSVSPVSGPYCHTVQWFYTKCTTYERCRVLLRTL